MMELMGNHKMYEVNPEETMLDKVLHAYGLLNGTVALLGNGLINRTWKVTANNKQYVLQRVNKSVFPHPKDIAANVKRMGEYLQTAHPGYLFTRPVVAADGEEMVCVDGAYYRLFPFVQGSHTLTVASTPEQAYEAAAQFGKFTRLLSGFDAAALKITLPHFHDLGFRYRQFLQAINTGNAERITAAKEVIDALLSKREIVAGFDKINNHPDFKLRVTHHDTKISNVLFDKDGKGLCVIDLDTVMPGFFISDVGDMLRTCLSPVNEEESDVEKITVRDEFYKAIVQGYRGATEKELSVAEQGSFFYAGEFMMYMQALRFLTDYLNNDIYYGAAYEGHNLVRAKNQTTLLQRFGEKRALLER